MPNHSLYDWIAIGCSLLAAVSYGCFSKFYEPLARKSKDPLYSAAILYGLAAVLLSVVILVAVACYGFNVNLPSDALVFNISISGDIHVALVFLPLIAVMSLLYYKHIVTEAEARRSIHMGAYSILFQLNVVVIALIDWLVYRPKLGWDVLLGGVLLLISTVGITFVYLFNINTRNKVVLAPFGKYAVYLGLVSAITCGGALYIDGEIGRHYIFRDGFKPEFSAGFLFYEMLTFGLPACWVLLNRLGKLGFRSALNELLRELSNHPSEYTLSSIFSAVQFLGAVFALSVPGPRFIVAVMLGLSPIFTIIMDYNPRSRRKIVLELTLGLVILVGFLLIYSD